METDMLIFGIVLFLVGVLLLLLWFEHPWGNSGASTVIRIGWGHSLSKGDIIRIGPDRYRITRVDGDCVTITEIEE
jgi:hypothetical protein